MEWGGVGEGNRGGGVSAKAGRPRGDEGFARM